MLEIKSVEQFDLLLGEGPLVADFWAPWCGPCRALTPVLEKFSQTRPEVRIVKVNVDEVPDLAVRYNVSAIPTLKFFKDSLLVNEAIGVVSEKVLEQKVETLY